MKWFETEEFQRGTFSNKDDIVLTATEIETLRLQLANKEKVALVSSACRIVAKASSSGQDGCPGLLMRLNCRTAGASYPPIWRRQFIVHPIQT